MPNPILGYVKRTVEGNRKPIEPAPEKYAGDNIPYLGVNDHGVKPNTDFRDPADDLPVPPDGRMVTVYEVEPKEPDPIPVHVVNRSARERRTFRAVTAYAGGTGSGQARRILGQDETRVQATIRCPEWGSVIYINDTPEQATAQFGYPILPGAQYVTETQGTVYATVPEVDDQLVAIAIEYRVSLDG